MKKKTLVNDFENTTKHDYSFIIMTYLSQIGTFLPNLNSKISIREFRY